MFIKKIGFLYLQFLLFANIIFAQKIVRGPYLQQPTQSSIVIRWRTEQPSETYLYIGKSYVNQKTLVINQDISTEHILKLENLEPNTKYFYSIYNVPNQNQFFKTAPDSTSKKPIRIWAGGDFGDISNSVYFNNQTQVRDSYQNYSKNFDTDLWLWLGDVGYGGNRDVQLQSSIFDFYQEKILSHIPFHATIGNHEFDENQAAQKTRANLHLFSITSPPTQGEAGGVASQTKAYYSFNYGNTHFINLDSYGMDDEKYRLFDIQGPQYQWLIKDFEANKSLWTVVFFHHPPYTKRAHDSDTEEELRRIREELVPVFDKYKVDLVLNGHSHIYERSYLIQDHKGTSQYFDPSYQIVNKNSGKYVKNEPPIINKTNGTTYVVAGTFGRLEPILALRLNDPAHPTSYYSNLITGGSLAIKIEDNRLDLEWLCADGVVRDRFTMFKNVQKTTKINLEYGEKTKLSASWPGTYRWSNATLNQKEIEVAPLANTVFFVKDSLGFLEDRFEIKVTAQPTIEPKLPINLIACAGRKIIGLAEIKNTDFEKWEYTIQLSDANGVFEKPIFSGKLNQAQFEIEIPPTAPESDKYKIRILPNNNLFEIKESPSFRINTPATATFANDIIIPFAPEVRLELNFKGTFPIDYMVDFQPNIQTTNENNVVYFVKQFERKSYEIISVKNICNEGEILRQKVTVEAPLGNELDKIGFKIYPNPAGENLLIDLPTTMPAKANIQNLFGQNIKSQNLQFGKNIISLDKLAKGTYYLKIEVDGKFYTKKIMKN